MNRNFERRISNLKTSSLGVFLEMLEKIKNILRFIKINRQSITKNLSKINRIRYITRRTCVDIVLTLLKQSRVRSIYFCNQKMR